MNPTPPDLPEFDPTRWGEEYAAAWALSKVVSEMPPADLTIHASHAVGELLRLYHLLFQRLAPVEIDPADWFHRPRLAQVLAAIAEAKRIGEGGEPLSRKPPPAPEGGDL